MKIISSFSGQHAFLSNFFPCEIEFEGITFPTSEHAFQAAKTLDPLIRQLISEFDTPGQAKRAGRQVSLRPLWDEAKVGVMEQILRIKFKNPDMQRLLLLTGNAILIEGNNWNDRFWGATRGYEDSRPTWKGQNNLGKLLMKIRRDLGGY